MIDRKEMELRLATVLAPMLFAVSIFALTVSTIIPNPATSILEELLTLLAALSIFSAALLIDSAMDLCQLGFEDRLTFIGGGYVCFCIVIGAMTAAAPIIYEAQQADSGLEWDISFVIYLGAGACVFMKMMTFKDRNVYTLGMIIFYTFTFYLLGS